MALGEVLAHLTFVPGELVPSAGVFALWGEDVDATASRLGFPVVGETELETLDVVDGESVALDVPAARVEVLAATRRLAALPSVEEWPSWASPPSSILAWSIAAKLALELVAAGRIVPSLRAGPDPHEAVAFWRVAAGGEARIRQLARAMPPVAFACRRSSTTLWEAEQLLVEYLDAVADACARQGRRAQQDPRKRGPRETFGGMWVRALSGVDPIVGRLRHRSEVYVDSMADWAAPLLPREPAAATMDFP